MTQHWDLSKANDKTNLIQSVRWLLPWQAEKQRHLRRREGRVGRQDSVVGWERRQGGLTHTRHRHRRADVQRLVERQSAKAVRVEVVRWEEGFGTQERWLGRWGEVFISKDNKECHVLSQQCSGWSRNTSNISVLPSGKMANYNAVVTQGNQLLSKSWSFIDRKIDGTCFGCNPIAKKKSYVVVWNVYRKRRWWAAAQWTWCFLKIT